MIAYYIDCHYSVMLFRIAAFFLHADRRIQWCVGSAWRNAADSNGGGFVRILSKGRIENCHKMGEVVKLVFPIIDWDFEIILFRKKQQYDLYCFLEAKKHFSFSVVVKEIPHVLSAIGSKLVRFRNSGNVRRGSLHYLFSVLKCMYIPFC